MTRSPPPPAFKRFYDDLSLFDDWEDRYRVLIDFGAILEPMPPALKTEATQVRGCASQVWLYAETRADSRLHFYADSDSHIVRGLIALVLALVQDRPAADVAALDIRTALGTLGLAGHLSPTRVNGLAAMVTRVGDLARQAMAPPT